MCVSLLRILVNLMCKELIDMDVLNIGSRGDRARR